MTNSKKDHSNSKWYLKPSNKTTTTVNTKKRSQTKNIGNFFPTVRQVKNKLLTHIHYGNEKQWTRARKNYRTVIAIFAANQTGPWNIFALRGEHNARTARKEDILPKCANPKPSVGYKNNQQRTVTPSHGLK